MIKIVIDSASDISQAEAKEMGIKVIPMKTAFGEDVYLDGVTIDQKRFYELLIESDAFPKTSLVSPGEYLEAFEECEDEVLCLTVSGALSGCYQSAVLAADGNSRVVVVDTKTVAIGERIMAEYALGLIEKGLCLSVIKEELEKVREKVVLIALLDTLEYLKKGGRISATLAAVGGLLSIKPVVGVKNGVIEMLGKARGSRNGRNLLRETIVKEGMVDFNLPFALAYSGLDSGLLDKYIEDSKELYAGYSKKLRSFMIGSTIGTHVGPGAIAIAYFADKIR